MKRTDQQNAHQLATMAAHLAAGLSPQRVAGFHVSWNGDGRDAIVTLVFDDDSSKSYTLTEEEGRTSAFGSSIP